MGWFHLSEQEEKYWGRFKAGDRMEVMLEQRLSAVYQSQIIQVDQQCLEIAIPRLGGTMLELEPRTGLVIHVFTDFGIFKFKTNVLPQQTQMMVTVAKPKKIEHIQRRQFYRLEAEIPVQYAETSLSADSVNPIMHSGMTRNVSEGGLLLVTTTIHGGGTLLKLLVNLAPNVWINAIGQVRRQKKLPMTEKLLTSLQFVKIAEKDRDAIRRFVLTHTIKIT